MVLVVRYFAGARAAAGLAEEKIELEASEPTIATVADLLAQRHGEALGRVLAVSSFLLDEVAGSRDRRVHDGAQLDVLPPFAGG